ncbi:hypothetical protein B9Z19DRAFT_1125444 [Tuber borchii]|uniref:Uncharacterized protein n=1 Tax=Tuber borchii TaxID=42251 RepID=A0A2T6ZUU8_TUBBO|nr:hypothetical protein B9Z19DRAFT_1125444 [Tuber borchii]
MVKFKPELASSPDTPPMHGVIKRSLRHREQRSRSPIEPVLVGTPGGEARPSLATKFRRFHPGLAQNRAETREKRSDSEPTAMIARIKLERLRPVRNAPNRLTDARALSQASTKCTLAVALPRTTSFKSKDGTEKRTLHRFPNEEHRFIWFYRTDLECSLRDTHVDFNEYFGPYIGKDAVENTYGRLGRKRTGEICEVPHTEPGAVREDCGTLHIVLTPDIALIENTAGQKTTEEMNESYTDSTDEGMSTLALAGREQEFVARNPIPNLDRTTLASSHRHPSSPKLKVKGRSSYQVNENGSPVSNPYTSSPQIRRAARKHKVEFDIDSDSNEYGNEVVKWRLKHRDYH